MKNVILILFGLCTPFFSYAQDKDFFEGVIKYKIDYTTSKNYQGNNPGDTAIVYLKNGYYRQDYPQSKIISTVIYRPQENRYYMILKNVDTIYYIDCSKRRSVLKSIQKDRKVLNVMGYDCKSMEFIFDHKRITYYYTEAIPVNYKEFSQHKFMYYDKFVKKAKSLYLKSIESTAMYEYKMTAVEILSRKLDDKIFELPMRAKIKPL